MIVVEAITVGLILLASETVANICDGRRTGDQIPNTNDCSSFYVCNYGEAKLFQCLDGLLYDPTKLVCNWAYLVNCNGQVQPNEHIPVLPNPPYVPLPDDYKPYPYNPEITIGPNIPEIPDHPMYTPHPPPIIDTYNPIENNEGGEFYPGLVETIPNVFHCTNPEFYFAPHPRNCEKYFICENYRIHDHQCGEGIHWDYVFNQCDYPARTFCYSHPNVNTAQELSSNPDHSDEDIGSDKPFIGVSPPIAINVQPVPLTEAFPEVEPEEEHASEPATEVPFEPETESTNEPVTEPAEEPVTEPAEEPVTEPAEEPVTEPANETVTELETEHTNEPETDLETDITTPKLICPGSQAFIAHPDDCHKYYICIGGIPIVTSCPKKMAWDKENVQCNEEAWFECFN